MLGKIYVLCARTWEWDRCGGGGRSGVHSVVVGVRVEGKSLWSFFLKFFYPWNSQRHRYGETGKDPEAGGLVQSVLSPSLLPYPAFPALPMVHLMLFFFFFLGRRKDGISTPFRHLLAMTWVQGDRVLCAVSTCFATGLSLLIRLAPAGDLYRRSHMWLHRALRSLPWDPLESSSAASYPLYLCEQERLWTWGWQKPPVSTSQHCSFVSCSPPPALGSHSTPDCVHKRGPELWGVGFLGPWALCPFPQAGIPSQGPFLCKRSQCAEESMVVWWDAHWGTCAGSWGPLWTCAPASSRVVSPAEMGGRTGW